METELNRREFVCLALTSSALLMNSGQLLDGEDAHSHSVAYSGAPRALLPGGRTA